MVDNKFEAAYPAGRFDLSMDLIEGNAYMYEFFGANIYYSLYKMLDSDEQAKLAAAAEQCLHTPETQIDECIHIQKGDGTADCYLISLQKSAAQNSYDVELINVTGCKSQISGLCHRLALAGAYLALQGEFLFTYNPSSNNFCLFYVNHGQTVVLYNMDFDAWKTLMHGQKRIAAQDLETFDTFCTVLKNLTVSRDFTFHGNIFDSEYNGYSHGNSNSNSESHIETYHVSFRFFEHGGSGLIATGTWCVINSNAKETNSAYIEDAYIDGLTGLLNKKAIMKYAEKTVTEGKNSHVALAIMDIDNFKRINDNYGHLFGDKVIKSVADVIKNAVKANAVAGRMGGDEFLIVFEKCREELEYRNILRCIRTNVTTVYQGQLGDDMISCSIGLARYGYGPSSTAYHDLFKIADKALYLAKQKGKNRYIIYKPELHGDYASEKGNHDMVAISDKFYSDDDVNALHDLFRDAIIAGSRAFPELIDQFTHTFQLNRVNVFYGSDRSPKYASPIGEDVCMANPSVLKCEKYLSLFHHDFLTLSNVHAIEYTIPDVYQTLADTKVSCLMQYILRDTEQTPIGLVSADNFDKFAQFPKVAVNHFINMCNIINAIILREGLANE